MPDQHDRAQIDVDRADRRLIELAKLNEVSAPDAWRTHHRLVELLTTAMVGDARRTKAGRGRTGPEWT
jgi:hypothetical protein